MLATGSRLVSQRSSSVVILGAQSVAPPAGHQFVSPARMEDSGPEGRFELVFVSGHDFSRAAPFRKNAGLSPSAETTRKMQICAFLVETRR
jgi:hypothetical protein